MSEVRYQLDDEALSVDARQSNRSTLLMKAVHHGQLEVVELLLERGADVNLQDDDNCTALWHAVAMNRTEIVRLLLDQGDIQVDLKQKDGWTPLEKVCYEGYQNIVELLLNKGSDVNAQDDAGYGPLWNAVQNNHPDIVKLLLDQDNILVDLKQGGWTPLKKACYDGYHNIAVLLLSKGADVNAQDNGGFWPLYDAVYKNHPDVVKLLLDQDDILVDLQQKSLGYSPLHKAAEEGNIVMINLLVGQGNASTSLRTKRGETPLEVAEKFNKTEAAQLLMSLG